MLGLLSNLPDLLEKGGVRAGEASLIWGC